MRGARSPLDVSVAFANDTPGEQPFQEETQEEQATTSTIQGFNH
jgi:hypothetical protein